MPRLFHRPPKYGRHEATKQAIVSIHGKRIYLGPYGSEASHRRYAKILDEWEQSRRREAPKDAPNGEAKPELTTDQLRQRSRQRGGVTITELIYVYRQHSHEYYRKNGELTREATIIDDALRILRKHHGVTLVETFGPVDLKSVREHMVDDLDWSRGHINKQVKRIVRVFRWGVAEEIVPPGRVHALEALAGLKRGRSNARETAPVGCVADEIVDATLTHMPVVVADMVRLQRVTGARPGEICSMRPCDIDRSKDVWSYVPLEHKTEHHGKQRTIFIGPKGQAILLPYLLRDAESHCFSPIDSEKKRRAKQHDERKTPLSCGNRPGTNRQTSRKRPHRDYYMADSYRRAIHRACEKAKVEKWAPHRLRHTAATEIRERFGLEASQVALGHASARITQLYADRDMKLAINVAKSLG